jgi:Glyoxalase-like domain
MATSWSLTIDCAHPAKLADFWALALGYVHSPPPAGFRSWEEWLTHHGVPEEEWGTVAPRDGGSRAAACSDAYHRPHNPPPRSAAHSPGGADPAARGQVPGSPGKTSPASSC